MPTRLQPLRATSRLSAAWMAAGLGQREGHAAHRFIGGGQRVGVGDGDKPGKDTAGVGKVMGRGHVEAMSASKKTLCCLLAPSKAR